MPSIQPENSGFSLLELMVVCVIISIFALIATPGYHTYKYKLRGKSAQANLTAIYHAQKRYKLDKAGPTDYYYCAGPGGACLTDLSDLNTNLSLAIFDPYFSYIVKKRGTSGFTAIATWKGGSAVPGSGCGSNSAITIDDRNTLMSTSCEIWVNRDCQKSGSQEDV